MDNETPAKPKKPRGTAAMDPETRQRVARAGGLKASQNRERMAQIGRKGGLAVSKNTAHMSEIGSKGGAASRATKPSDDENLF